MGVSKKKQPSKNALETINTLTKTKLFDKLRCVNYFYDLNLCSVYVYSQYVKYFVAVTNANIVKKKTRCLLGWKKVKTAIFFGFFFLHRFKNRLTRTIPVQVLKFGIVALYLKHRKARTIKFVPLELKKKNLMFSHKTYVD